MKPETLNELQCTFVRSNVEAKDSHIHERNTKGCRLPDSYKAFTYTSHYIMLLLIGEAI